MTHEEAIETISRCQTQIRASIRLHVEALRHYDIEIARAMEALRQPQEPTMTRYEAINKAIDEHQQLQSNLFRVIANNGGVQEVEFYQRGRKTTAVMRDTFNGLVIGVGRSWCAKGDRNSSHVGRLIAFYRALGREVPAWLLHIPQE